VVSDTGAASGSDAGDDTGPVLRDGAASPAAPSGFRRVLRVRVAGVALADAALGDARPSSTLSSFASGLFFVRRDRGVAAGVGAGAAAGTGAAPEGDAALEGDAASEDGASLEGDAVPPAGTVLGDAASAASSRGAASGFRRAVRARAAGAARDTGAALVACAGIWGPGVSTGFASELFPVLGGRAAEAGSGTGVPRDAGGTPGTGAALGTGAPRDTGVAPEAASALGTGPALDSCPARGAGTVIKGVAATTALVVDPSPPVARLNGKYGPAGVPSNVRGFGSGAGGVPPRRTTDTSSKMGTWSTLQAGHRSSQPGMRESHRRQRPGGATARSRSATGPVIAP